MAHYVSSILQRKNRPTLTASPDTSVFEALEIMADKNIGSLVIMKGDTYMGILTERDYARKIILKGKSSAETTVSEIMSTDLPIVHRRDTIERCMDLMSELNVRYLPVLDGKHLVGVLSIKDLVDEMILIQRETITHLQTYISGTY